MNINDAEHDALMKKMLNEARFQIRMLGEMIHWAENQEWARRKGNEQP